MASGLAERLFSDSCTLLTMASNPRKSRTQGFFKAMGHGFHTSRSSSPQPPTHRDANTTNPLLKPPEVTRNQSRDSIVPHSDPGSPSLHWPAHAQANAVNGDPDVPAIVDASQPRGDEPSIWGRPSQRPSSTRPGHNYSDWLVKAGSVGGKGLVTALRLLEKSADAFPPLSSLPLVVYLPVWILLR